MGDACQWKVEPGTFVGGYDLSKNEFKGDLGEKDDLECLTIYVTKAEKVSLHELWHHMLIIKILG